jgi:hypothetical protein
MKCWDFLKYSASTSLFVMTQTTAQQGKLQRKSKEYQATAGAFTMDYTFIKRVAYGTSLSWLRLFNPALPGRR